MLNMWRASVSDRFVVAVMMTAVLALVVGPVAADGTRPVKPAQNAYIESFNGKFRDECLNEHWFTDVTDAKRVIEAWRVEYNTFRPHSSLGGLTPEEFAVRQGQEKSVIHCVVE